MRRRLFDQFEQGVEAFGGDHMGFVDDIDFVPAARGRKERALTQIARVVDAAVCCRIDFNDVNAARSVARQIPAALTLPAWLGHRALLAVERPSQDTGAGGLAAPARTGKKIGVMYTGLLYGVAKTLVTILL